jgi:hypothetical protein
MVVELLLEHCTEVGSFGPALLRETVKCCQGSRPRIVTLLARQGVTMDPVPGLGDQLMLRLLDIVISWAAVDIAASQPSIGHLC